MYYTMLWPQISHPVKPIWAHDYEYTIIDLWGFSGKNVAKGHDVLNFHDMGVQLTLV